MVNGKKYILIIVYGNTLNKKIFARDIRYSNIEDIPVVIFWKESYRKTVPEGHVH